MYQVRFYLGDYRERQEAANADGCVAYVEHHFNSSANAGANYTLVIAGSNASTTSCNWGRWYARSVSRAFDVPVGGDQGLVVGGFEGRGDYNLRFTQMPAILLEPLFVSNPQHARQIRSDAGQNMLARILAESIQRFFPSGGLIGFSVGHKYKRSCPDDRGADVLGGGCEADYAEKVLYKAEALLKAAIRPPAERQIRVLVGEQTVWARGVDFDAQVTWDDARGVLTIRAA
jgi:hypothetical protein